MKTSNKLLLGFIGVLFAGMLTSNFILKAKYDKIKSEKIEADEYRTLSKEAFKYLKVDGTDANFDSRISVEFAPDYEISSFQDISEFAKINFKGDTLLVKFEKIPDSLNIHDGRRLIIRCPSMYSFELQNIDGSMNKFKVSDLIVKLKGSSSLNVLENQIDNLIIEESDSSSCDLNMDYQEEEKGATQSYINHLKLTLKDRSSFKADDIPFKTIDPIVGDSADISLSGASLRPLLKKNVQQ
ncbi:hypothetical protein [Xanthocytophaga agilis]|uniref:Uncharacterized protein n=1 Tax=Xanthocytophaga agilis TaxID=3048010 RepID=A0AAE3UFF6_9BACT|nr:hypothetical protein [Xanthocytophaga agilis]MDJ1503190.1 hypothetical protein [Xanthocytophaga agilis]